MWRTSYYFILIYSLQCVAGLSELCGNRTEQQTLSCTTQILGNHETDSNLCKMYSPNSEECGTMDFGAFSPNTQIGGVILKPYIMPMTLSDSPFPTVIYYTVLNITFSNIKWKKMKFRFQDKIREQQSKSTKQYRKQNHCESIVISNDVNVDDKSVLYYDCYWTKTDERDGQSHTLDFEASDDKTVKRGQYYFNIPSAEMLSPSVKAEKWKPFIYVEILLHEVRLHIMPPPAHLKISHYDIKVMKEVKNGTEVKSAASITVKNNTDEVLYDYKIVGENGRFHFLVEPTWCTEDLKCKGIESPKFYISNETQALDICIASVTALVVATLFAYYIALRMIRKYFCKDYTLALGNEIMLPQTKVLVIYSPANRLHAACVASFVNYLRSECGFDVMFDGDISSTSHSDPYIWATEAFKMATHVMYIVSPTEESNVYNSIYDKPIITAHKDVDVLLLSFVRASRASKTPKEIFNVFFEHSKGAVPVETRHDKVFFLLKDWQKLVSFLSKNLMPRKHIMRTDRGRCFLEDLSRAKEMLSAKKDEVLIRCEKVNAFEKKILL